MTVTGRALDRAFFARPSPVVAGDLLGCVLACPRDGTAVRIIEVEAYDQSEPAAHSHRGPTPRTAVMFGPAGHLYTYFTYGMHWCANVVTGQPGEGQAVLFRAAEVLAGQEVLRGRRGEGASDRDLLRGPARLARALGLGREHDGADLVPGRHDDGRLRVLARQHAPAVARGPRVGVRLAADLPWRFWIADHPLVSAYRRHPRADQAG